MAPVSNMNTASEFIIFYKHDLLSPNKSTSTAAAAGTDGVSVTSSSRVPGCRTLCIRYKRINKKQFTRIAEARDGMRVHTTTPTTASTIVYNNNI